VEQLLALRSHVLQASLIATSDPLRLVVVGGGLTGVELMGELTALVTQIAPQRPIQRILVMKGPQPALGISERFSQLVQSALAKQGVELWPNSIVQAVQAQSIHLQYQGQLMELTQTLTVWAAGLRVENWLTQSGLPTAPDGSVQVDRYLRAEARIFAMGDCAYFGEGLPRLGVYAVRQAPIIAHNLLAIITGLPLRTFHPQRQAFVSVTTGRDRAVMHNYGFTYYGRGALWGKNLFDYLYMRMYKPVNGQKYQF